MSSINELEDEYNFRHPKSRRLFERALKSYASGVTHDTRFAKPFPIYATKAKSTNKWDVDGNEYLDCVVNYGACILGHGHPDVVEAVKGQLESGLTCGIETELSVRLAERLSQMIPCGECVKFSNTGTEAVIEVRTRPPSIAAARPVDCTIKRQQARRDGPLVLHATCPSAVGIQVGSYGNILDPKPRRPIKQGTVRVKSIKGKSLVVEAAQLRKRVQAVKIRFWVR